MPPARRAAPASAPALTPLALTPLALTPLAPTPPALASSARIPSARTGPARGVLAAVALALAAFGLTACNRAAQPVTVPGPAGPALATTATATTTTPPPGGGSGSGGAGTGTTDAGSTGTSDTPDPTPTAPASFTDFFRHGLGTMVPAGWTKDQTRDDHTDFKDASGELLLRIGTATVNTTPDVYLRGLAGQAAKTYAGYHQITLSTTAIGGSRFPYAVWECTFVKDGVTRHLIEAAFAPAVNARQTIGQVYFSAPSRYFDKTLVAWGHAVNGVNVAG